MNTASSSTFHSLGIGPDLLKVLDQLKFTTPTPIQHKAIPLGLAGQDVIGIAQTGTGKTLAFGIPMIQRLAAGPGQGLILLPTRELALQVNESLARLCAPFRMGSVVLIGGESMHHQLRGLKQQPRILIATPGRLNDHLQQRTVRLDGVKVLVLDEADRMLDMGFLPQIENVLRLVPRERQTMLFSATMPTDIVKIASHHMRMPVRTEIAPPGTAAEKVSQELFVVQRDHKAELLAALLKEYEGTVLVFVRTRRAAHRVAKVILDAGHSVAEIHADRSLNQRKAALAGFKSGAIRVMVATDIAARGIDVSGIEVVINYDLPDEPDNYVHRIGRTGRAGKEGHAISLATPDQGQDVKRIERILRATIPVAEHPEVPPAKFDPNAQPPPRGGRGGGGGGGGGGRGQGGGGRGHGGGGGGGGGRSPGPRRSHGPGEAHPPARAGGGGYGGLRAPGSGSGAAHPPKGGGAPKTGKVGHAFRGRKHF